MITCYFIVREVNGKVKDIQPIVGQTKESCVRLNEINKRLANLKVDGVTSKQLNELWVESNEGLYDFQLPETKAMHISRYIKALEQFTVEGKKNEMGKGRN